MQWGVLPALQEYEQRLRALGSAVVPRLQPGLSDEQIRELEAEYGFALPAGACAVWQWHDGTRSIDQYVPPGLTPGRVFLSLREAMQESREVADDINPILKEDGADDRLWSEHWLPITTTGSHHLVLDCTHQQAEAVRTMPFFPDAGVDSFIHMPLTHRVNWWNWALENKAWTVNPDGTWKNHFERYPKGPGMDNVLI